QALSEISCRCCAHSIFLTPTICYVTEYSVISIYISCPHYLVSKRLGHANVRITLDVYGHLYPSRESEMIEKLNSLIAQNSI
ncbi:MAG: hypothetical protein FWE97_04675, partial [Dehalococcoidia bacterium]|nr:hypothetical protein [Dehalococcoidia bacterium]